VNSFHFEKKAQNNKYAIFRKKIKANPSPIYENKFVLRGETFHERNEQKSNTIATMLVAKIIQVINLFNPPLLFLAGIEKLPFFF
jgi:hypothetical protein